MRSISSPAGAGISVATKMIWLPGAYQLAQHFVDEGFAGAAAKRGAPLDLLFVDLESAHLEDREPLEKLRSEIVLPARTAGVSVWLAGISLGGLVALDYACDHAGDIDGLFLLAPYLGNRRLAQSDTDRRIWRYINARDNPAPMFLSYGRQDRFSTAHALMAAALPANCVDVIDGGHDWPTWFKLWERFLDVHFA